MKARHNWSRFLTPVVIVLVTLSCTLPGLIPLTRLPKMEKNADTVLEILNGNDWHPLQALAVERYSRDELAKPGIITFTVKITDSKPTYFSYGWCTKDGQTLRQNLEQMDVSLYLNGDELGEDVVHNLSFDLTDGQQCLDFGVLLSEWPTGEFELKAIATFAGKINDGFSDYAAGDYIYEYHVSVEEAGGKESTRNSELLRINQ